MSRLSGITFQQVEVFLVAAKYENFTKAAEVLYMTQASVSRNILNMEFTLGLVLFIRHKRHVTLTNAGRSLVVSLQQIMQQSESALDNAYLQQQNQMQNLIIGDVNWTSMDSYLIPISAEFEKAYPHVEYIIKRDTPSVVYENMLAEQYDAAFFVSESIPDKLTCGLKSDLIFELDPCIILANNHPLFRKKDISIEELKNQPLVAMHDEFQMGYWKFAYKVCQEVGLNYGDIKNVDNEFTLAVELKRGKRVAISNHCFSAMNQNELRFIPLRNCKIKSGIVLIYSNENTNPYLLKFCELCKNMGPELIHSLYH
ncbi:LysR family transcriptional regulator [Novisyntrophococcus fermenticellae]|uniref:LysR family transcriptional regulator n=1 Tax=Novisyntrophococcus fermenticellae TaxID=2068655 RepID=UPI001E49F735|nr:LysR family transcriptional regulator [Novisyntrophococcus fermenticellae]